jgi:hypothetical protein
MRPALLIGCFLLVATTCHAATPCSPQAKQNAAKTVATLRKQLMAVSVSLGEDTAPGQSILKLKDSLNEAAQTVLACHDTSTSPAVIQRELASLLHANLPEPPDEPPATADDIDKPVTDVFGTDLKVRVTGPPSSPQLLSVQFSFGISCGDDNVLLLFEAENTGWKEAMRWQSPLLTDIGHAFGDFFVWSILPGEGTQTWRVVVAHGKPWCTSRISGFNIDVLEPTASASRPRVVWHTDRGYSRGDFEPSLKASGNIFELRLNEDAMHFDMNQAFERRAIYRYRVTANIVDRIEPIAINARGFVEEWLDMPWNEAAAQTTDSASLTLKGMHVSFQQEPKDEKNSFIEPSFGPVLACKQTKQFQVEFDASRETFVPNKPGGDSKPLPSTYFRVLETGDGYQMLSATHKPDPSCNGRDLMPAKH